MTTRTSHPAGGALLISELKEFASFSKATQRYVRRSLDIAFGRTDPIATWARDEAEALPVGRPEQRRRPFGARHRPRPELGEGTDPDRDPLRPRADEAELRAIGGQRQRRRLR